MSCLRGSRRLLLEFYLFKALKGVEGTCINHNYFTHTKISQRTTVRFLLSNAGRLKGEGVRQREGELER